MNVLFTDSGWVDYLYWQQADKRMLRKVNELIRDIQREPFGGLGKPEPLRHNLSGCWARRIDQEHRLVYRVVDDTVRVLQCRFHYKDD